MLSVVLEVSVAIRGQLDRFLLRRNEVFKYCFANKGQVDVWIIGRDPIPEAKRKRDHFRRIYEFLYRLEQTRVGGMPLWRTVEGSDDRGPMQEIRERLGMVSEPPEADSLLKDAVVKDVMLWSCSSEEMLEDGLDYDSFEETRTKEYKGKAEQYDAMRVALERSTSEEMLEDGLDYDSFEENSRRCKRLSSEESAKL